MKALFITILFVISVALLQSILSYVRKEHNANKQSREILDLIKTNNPTTKEPIFNHNIQPDFSGYFE